MPNERTASLMQSAVCQISGDCYDTLIDRLDQEDRLPEEGFEEIPGARLFKYAGGLRIEGHAKHITIYDPTATTNHYEASNQEVKEEVPQGHYVRIIGPARVKFVRM